MTTAAEKAGARELASGPLFVVSMWRSGSSLLYALLNKHPHVAIMFEADLVLLRPVFWKPGKFNDWAKRWEFWNSALSRHQVTINAGAESITDFSTAFTEAHQQFARQKGASVWGDKSPNYYDRIREIANAFPGAKFIIVWRNPEHVVNSVVRAGHGGSPYFAKRGAALRGLLGHQILKKQVDWLVDHNQALLQINYEELISETPSIMRTVCEFLGIPYFDELSTLTGADRSAIYEFGGTHHTLVKGDQIVTAGRPNALDNNLRLRVAGYMAFWRKQYAGKWPAFPKITSKDDAAPPALQRITDSLAYFALRAFDKFTALAFCFLPVALLSGYRRRKYGNEFSPMDDARNRKGEAAEVRA